MTIRQNIYQSRHIKVIEDYFECSLCKRGVVARIGMFGLKWTCKKIRHVLMINSTFHFDQNQLDPDLHSRYHLRGIKCICKK